MLGVKVRPWILMGCRTVLPLGKLREQEVVFVVTATGAGPEQGSKERRRIGGTNPLVIRTASISSVVEVIESQSPSSSLYLIL